MKIKVEKGRAKNYDYWQERVRFDKIKKIVV